MSVGGIGCGSGCGSGCGCGAGYGAGYGGASYATDPLLLLALLAGLTGTRTHTRGGQGAGSAGTGAAYGVQIQAPDLSVLASEARQPSPPAASAPPSARLGECSGFSGCWVLPPYFINPRGTTVNRSSAQLRTGSRVIPHRARVQILNDVTVTINGGRRRYYQVRYEGPSRQFDNLGGGGPSNPYPLTDVVNGWMQANTITLLSPTSTAGTGAAESTPGTIQLADKSVIDVALQSKVFPPAAAKPADPGAATWLALAELSRCGFDQRGCRVWKPDLSGVIGVARPGALAATYKEAPDGSTALFDQADPTKGAFAYAVFQDGKTEGWVNPLAFRPIWNDLGWIPPKTAGTAGTGAEAAASRVEALMPSRVRALLNDAVGSGLLTPERIALAVSELEKAGMTTAANTVRQIGATLFSSGGSGTGATLPLFMRLGVKSQTPGLNVTRPQPSDLAGIYVSASIIGSLVKVGDRVFIRPVSRDYVSPSIAGLISAGLIPPGIEAFIIRVEDPDPTEIRNDAFLRGRIEGYRLNGLDYLKELGPSGPFPRSAVYARNPNPTTAGTGAFAPRRAGGSTSTGRVVTTTGCRSCGG